MYKVRIRQSAYLPLTEERISESQLVGLPRRYRKTRTRISRCNDEKEPSHIETADGEDASSIIHLFSETNQHILTPQEPWNREYPLFNPLSFMP